MALVLFSGGQDSTTCLAMAKHKHSNVEAICIDYGQRHRIELDQAKIIADRSDTPLTIIKTDLLAQLTNSALTQADQKIEIKQNALPSTFVPGRNQLFLTLAAIVAYQKKISVIYTGVCQTDYSGYPDCRDDFIQSLTQTINLAMNTTITIETPLMWLTKAETIRVMQTLGRLDWYADTHTCYEGVRPACGQCPACKLRLKGFNDAGVVDPLTYVT